MPAINPSIYVNLATDGGPLWNTVNDIPTAVPLGTEPNSTKGANPYLEAPIYYVNNDNEDLSGYIYIPEGYSLDTDNIYIFSDSAREWRTFTSVGDCLENLGEATNGSMTYTVWKYGYNDEDFGWMTTRRNISFNLTTA